MKSQDSKLKLFVIIFGFVSGISVYLNRLASQSPKMSSNISILQMLLEAVIFTISLWGIRNIVCKIIEKSALPASVRTRYKMFDIYIYAVFVLSASGALGIQCGLPAIFLIIVIFIILQYLLIYFLMEIPQRRKVFLSLGWISFLFLISGFAALIYQIVWQRTLFTAFGVNIESITVIVSIFMFGLGIGSIVGGILSRRFPSTLPQLFLIFEVLIGIFGVFSLPLIQSLSSVVVHGSVFQLSFATYAVLSIPTMLMGATLPILVAYLHKTFKNVGKSLGILYFMNTIGSALACFITVTILFVFFGQKVALLVAATCNFTVGILVYRYIRNLSIEPVSQNISISAHTPGNLSPDIYSRGHNDRSDDKHQITRFSMILLLSFLVGYISLSQEIIWVKSISYVTGGKPNDFAYMLGFFLLGIALSSLMVKKLSEKEGANPMIFIATMLSISSVLYYFALPICCHLLTRYDIGLYVFYISVAITAFFIGGIFPMLCHYGIKSESAVGFSLSWIYFANILGSTAGPLFTGFILLNSQTLEQNALLLSAVTLFIGCIIWMAAPVSIRLKIALVSIAACGIPLMFLTYDDAYSQIIEKMHYKMMYVKKNPYKYIVQNRVGIIAVESSKTDIIYGGGVYDGQFNLDPVLNTNGIRRAYMIAALHPNPEEVLEIGLSSGSWARVIANHTTVKKLIDVEINPGYIEIIKKYPEIATIFHDPKITFVIDDGRRWLKRHPEAKFDVVVWNASFHWRNYATNTLSEEFLKICKAHLKPGGIIYYNTTGSEDIPYAAAHVFKYVTLYDSFVAASDTPFSMTTSERRKNLLNFQNSGKPFFANNNIALQSALDALVKSALSDIAPSLLNRTDLLRVTDDNMATEFKREYKWFKKGTTWANLFKYRQVSFR